MPKFRTEEFFIQTKEKQGVSFRNNFEHKNNLAFKADVFVNSEGIFYVALPDDVVEKCKAFKIDLHYVGRGSRTKNNVIASETFEKLLKEVERILSPLVDYEVLSVKKYIRYSFGGYVHYTSNEAGEIEFNGYRRGEQGTGWYWLGSEASAYKYEPYSVNIGMQVVEKTVIRYGDGKEKELYKNVVSANQDETPHLYELLRVVQIAVSGKYQEIEYTEQTAKAFCVAITGIIKIYDSLQKFNHKETFLDFVNTQNIDKLLM